MSGRRCPCCGAPSGVLIKSSGCSFLGSDHARVNGVLVGRLETPRLLGDGNVLWPRDWTEADRRTWRVMMDMPGAEWAGEGDA